MYIYLLYKQTRQIQILNLFLMHLHIFFLKKIKNPVFSFRDGQPFWKMQGGATPTVPCCDFGLSSTLQSRRKEGGTGKEQGHKPIYAPAACAAKWTLA